MIICIHLDDYNKLSLPRHRLIQEKKWLYERPLYLWRTVVKVEVGTCTWNHHSLFTPYWPFYCFSVFLQMSGCSDKPRELTTTEFNNHFPWFFCCGNAASSGQKLCYCFKMSPDPLNCRVAKMPSFLNVIACSLFISFSLMYSHV